MPPQPAFSASRRSVHAVDRRVDTLEAVVGELLTALRDQHPELDVSQVLSIVNTAPMTSQARLMAEPINRDVHRFFSMNADHDSSDSTPPGVMTGSSGLPTDADDDNETSADSTSANRARRSSAWSRLLSRISRRLTRSSRSMYIPSWLWRGFIFLPLGVVFALILQWVNQ